MPQPIFLGGLITYFGAVGDVGTTFGLSPAYTFAGALILSNGLFVLFMHTAQLSQYHCGMKMRIAMCSIIYRKSLRLSNGSLGNMSVGQVVNLLSNDVSRLDSSIVLLHYLWLGPIETVIVSYLVYCEIGWPSFVGVAIMLSFVPMQGYLGHKSSAFRWKVARKTDERVRLMNEIIQGIRVIKMYAWERPFGRLVKVARM